MISKMSFNIRKATTPELHARLKAVKEFEKFSHHELDKRYWTNELRKICRELERRR